MYLLCYAEAIKNVFGYAATLNLTNSLCGTILSVISNSIPLLKKRDESEGPESRIEAALRLKLEKRVKDIHSLLAEKLEMHTLKRG